MTKLHNLRKKSVAIELEGSTYYLRFDLNAMAAVEEKFGDFNKAMEKLDEGSVIVIRYFMWALLQANHEEMTEKDVGALFDLNNIKEAGEKVGEAIVKGSPEPKEADKKAGGSKNAKKPRTGDTSSAAQEKPELAKKSSGS